MYAWTLDCGRTRTKRMNILRYFQIYIHIYICTYLLVYASRFIYFGPSAFTHSLSHSVTYFIWILFTSKKLDLELGWLHSSGQWHQNHCDIFPISPHTLIHPHTHTHTYSRWSPQHQRWRRRFVASGYKKNNKNENKLKLARTSSLYTYIQTYTHNNIEIFSKYLWWMCKIWGEGEVSENDLKAFASTYKLS